MTLFVSKNGSGKVPVQTLNDGRPGMLLFEYLTTAALAAGDIIDLGPYQAGMSAFDVVLITDDLDTNGAPTVTLSVGLLNAGKTDLSGGTNETFIVASTAGQAGGVTRATTPSAYLLGPSATERRLGIKVVAAPATNAAVGKKIAVLLTATQ